VGATDDLFRYTFNSSPVNILRIPQPTLQAFMFLPLLTMMSSGQLDVLGRRGLLVWMKSPALLSKATLRLLQHYNIYMYIYTYKHISVYYNGLFLQYGKKKLLPS
jgi:hypothetical protein